MPRVKSFDKVILKGLRDLIDSRLEDLGKEIGAKIHAGNASFESNRVTFKLHVELENENGDVVSKEAEDFMRLAEVYGVNPTAIGYTFNSQGQAYAVSGLKTRGRKYPFIAKRLSDGRMFKFSAEIISRHFPKDKEIA